jgi:putative ABC transport system permease protein
MIKTYLKTAWRNSQNSLAFTAINIFGLAAALTSFILILLYLNYNLSYDKWNPDLKKVYRVSMQDRQDILQTTPAPLAGFLANKYPNTEAATSLQSDGDFPVLVAAGGKKLYQKNVVTADSNFLRVLPYHLIKGDPRTALNPPNAALISAELSAALFGNTDPIGQPLKVYNAINCVVTGVFAQPQNPTHLPVSMVMRDPYGKSNNFWENMSYQTYIKLKTAVSDVAIEDGINRVFYAGHLKTDNTTYEKYSSSGQATTLFIDPIGSIHNFPKHGASNFAMVSLLLALAVLLLLAGAINFSNLAVAQSIKRAKEVGVRKVLGSNRGQLIAQFMTETTVQCLVSLGLALLAVSLLLPYFNQAFGVTLHFWGQGNAANLSIQILGCIVAVIPLSGGYPAFFLSRFNTSKVLKGDYSTGTKGTILRNALIVLQFMVAVFFVTGVATISAQINYLEKRDKGFSGTQVMRIQAAQKTRDANFETNRQQLLSIPGVRFVAKTTNVPGDQLFVDTSTLKFTFAGSPYRMASIKVSTDYFKTLGVSLVAGRNFTAEPADQQTRSAIINQSAAAALHVSDPVGKTLFFPECDTVPVQIVGVVRDFNEGGFERAVQPEVYTIGNKACMFQSGGAILVKIGGNQLPQSVAGIVHAWNAIEPDFPIQYSFLDTNFGQLLDSYDRLKHIITLFGAVALVISITGLFALTTFFTGRRTKEIGIRRVLGANTAQLIVLLGREFVLLVGLSVLLTVPLAWWAVHEWLQTFAYRIQLSWLLFFAAGAGVLLIAIATISVQSIRAAFTNPAQSLRNE